MKKTLAFLMAGAMAAAALVGCSAKNDTSSAASDAAATTAATADGDWDYISGFETDFATAVCKELGVEPKFQEIEWDSKEIELNAKTIDCIWNGLTITAEREANMSITLPYMSNKQVMVVKAENADKYKTAADVKGAKVVAEAGSAGEEVAKGEDFFKEATYTPADSQAKAIIDYVMTIGTLRAGSDYSDLKMVEGQDFSPEVYGIAFRKGSDASQKVSDTIVKLYNDGKLQEIAKKYNLEEQIPKINANAE